MKNKSMSITKKSTEIAMGQHCKGNCKFCLEKGNKPIQYDFDVYFEQIKLQIKKLRPYKVIVNENNRSDPLDEPRLAEVINWLSSRSYIGKIVIQTSGLYPFPKDIKWSKKICFNLSIDGIEETHDINRGEGSFKKSFQFFKDIYNKNYNIMVLTLSTSDVLEKQYEIIKFWEQFPKIVKYDVAYFVSKDKVFFNRFVAKSRKIKVANYNPQKHFPRFCISPNGTSHCFSCNTQNTCIDRLYPEWREKLKAA